MTKLLMCSGVSSITQQLAERMSQAWGQGQAQARGQPGWLERQKDCIWNSAGTLLSWSSESWQSTQMGPRPLLLLRGLMENSLKGRNRPRVCKTTLQAKFESENSHVGSFWESKALGGAETPKLILLAAFLLLWANT